MDLTIKKVSCHVITYNHVNYISKCIDGILMQKTNFNFEIIIGDDVSTDGTRELVQQYALKYPDKIKLNLRDVRGIGIPGKENFVSTLKMCHGEYITLCDGDDYWTDPHKLQKQVDFLEANNQYIIHSGSAQVLRNNNFCEIIGCPLAKDTYRLPDFYVKNNLITCTIMFRNTITLDSFFTDVLFGDWMLSVLILAANKGKAAYVSNEIYSVYRVHGGGVMQTISNEYDNAVAHLKHISKIKKLVKCNYSKDDCILLNSYHVNIFKHFYIIGNLKNYLKIFTENFLLTKSHLSIKLYLSVIKHYSLKKSFE